MSQGRDSDFRDQTNQANKNFELSNEWVPVLKKIYR